MEDKIEIKATTTVEELTEIINSNGTTEVAEAFHKYMRKHTDDWYEQYDRAKKAEKELAGIKDVLVKFALNQMQREIDKSK